jgi:hypothetical protein
MTTEHVIRWALIVAASLLVLGLIAYGRGSKHYHGDQVGSHGTKVVIIHVVP